MSWVTDILLIFDVSELYDECGFERVEVCALNEINRWLQTHNGTALDPLDQSIMGNQGIRSCVYGGAFANFSIDEFVEMVRSQPWQHPEQVQLLVQNEEDECFVVYPVIT